MPTDPLQDDALRVLALDSVRSFRVPEKAKDVYPHLHGAAYAIEGVDAAKALGAVFAIVSAACGVKYGSQYMSNVIMARHKDGTLQARLSEATA